MLTLNMALRVWTWLLTWYKAIVVFLWQAYLEFVFDSIASQTFVLRDPSRHMDLRLLYPLESVNLRDDHLIDPGMKQSQDVKLARLHSFARQLQARGFRHVAAWVSMPPLSWLAFVVATRDDPWGLHWECLEFDMNISTAQFVNVDCSVTGWLSSVHDRRPQSLSFFLRSLALQHRVQVTALRRIHLSHELTKSPGIASANSSAKQMTVKHETGKRCIKFHSMPLDVQDLIYQHLIANGLFFVDGSGRTRYSVKKVMSGLGLLGATRSTRARFSKLLSLAAHCSPTSIIIHIGQADSEPDHRLLREALLDRASSSRRQTKLSCLIKLECFDLSLRQATIFETISAVLSFASAAGLVCVDFYMAFIVDSVAHVDKTNLLLSQLEANRSTCSPSARATFRSHHFLRTGVLVATTATQSQTPDKQRLQNFLFLHGTRSMQPIFRDHEVLGMLEFFQAPNTCALPDEAKAVRTKYLMDLAAPRICSPGQYAALDVALASQREHHKIITD
ncbi:hypothetical protein KVT40_009239 [Elsinoe batatas]|uniref:Uncharacterized protein n=1 Tax=Elsinoe batatas TaxID=2601811 RepID=A0A8K0PBX1_9PEZI|nr:hypothetical protein KVT40_009239 [Elsinoe batatas]